MMKSNAGLANEVIERIRELSADTHIKRREVAKDSPAFHNLTGVIGSLRQGARTSHGGSTAGRIRRNGQSK